MGRFITATKREENLRDIPASISAFQGDTLERQGKFNLEDYLQETPGVVINSQGPGTGIRITIRGIATETNPTSSRPSPVGIFIGDTAFTDPYIAGLIPDLNAFDLESVQVLKGPQGTLFGGAALSGAIRYVLKDPVLDEWQGAAFTQYVDVTEGDSAFTSGVALNLPWAGRDVALRVGYVKRNYPGVIDDSRAGEKDVNDGGGEQKRAILLWTPTDALSLKLTHLDQDFSGDNQKFAVVNADGPREMDLVVIPEPARNSFSLDSFEARYDFDSMRLVSLTSYTDKQRFSLSDYTPLLIGRPPEGYPADAAIVSFSNVNSDALSQELRLQSTDNGDFKWLVGAYFYDYSLDFELFIGPALTQSSLGAGTPIGELTDLLENGTSIGQLAELLGLGTLDLANQTSLLYATNRAKSQERAVYFDLTQTLGNLELSVGARFYQTFVDGGFIGTGALARATNNGLEVDQRNRIEEQGISPRFSITYRFTDDVMVYTAASRGFRFGGLQSVPSSPVNGVPETYKSDSLWNYEVGTRTSWLDNTLQLDLTAFFIEYTDPQITQKTQGTSLNFVTNVGAAESYGIEAAFLWLPPISGLTVSLSGGLTEARTTEAFTSSSNTVIEPGTQLPGAAKSQYSVGLQQFLPLGRLLLDATMNYTYVGKSFSTLERDLAVNDYGVLSAGLGLSSDTLPLSPRLSLNVANILNETALVDGAADSSPIIPLSTFSLFALNPPRTVSLRLNLSF
ncbi:TonB-dependent receptor [Polycyclovorans algicola]|uniref:TonB-dependent receptor n=1 Tax=Polycyclovorans algicola TaxID=616992 RepID=UPI000694EADF|nr:TonB-dependent receptor [Polycyclovorans algicola]